MIPLFRALFVTVALLVAALTPSDALALSPVNMSYFTKVAIDGTDPVAYFTDSKPVPGKEEFSTTWKGATWYFASAEHRDLFVKDPARYAPQYGGYCAWAVSQGYTASGDPLVWKIVNGRLFLNYDQSVQTTWEKDIPGHIASADKNWPGVLGK